MTSQVSGLAGYNYYFKNSDGTYTKLNPAPIADGTHFTATNLTADTDYTGQFYVTSIDKAGNESAKVEITGAQTVDPTPDELPMSSTLTTAIDAIVAKCMAAGDPAPGVTLSIVSPKGYYTKTYGSGTGDNLYFRVASQTKSFTGTAVLRAVDQGLIALDDTLSTYLDGYAVDPTIQQMLMMQSGIYDYELASGSPILGLIPTTLGTSFTLNPTMAYSVDQIIALIKAGGKMFDPGTQYYYTNSNYYVLAKIVEAVDPSARTIDQVITQDILTPLGLVNTYFELGTGTPQAPYAVGYDYNPILSILGLVQLRDVSSQNTNFIWASGAIVSQVSDMIKWGKELRDGTLLSPEMHNLRMTTFAAQPQTGAGAFGLNFNGPPTFGYGLAQLQIGSWFGHDGSWLGYDSCTMFNPGTGTVITVYENFQTSTPHTLAALTTIWYEIAEYLYPGSTFNENYDLGGPYTGTMAATLQPAGAALATNIFEEGAFTFPGTFPAAFTAVSFEACTVSAALQPLSASFGAMVPEEGGFSFPATLPVTFVPLDGVG